MTNTERPITKQENKKQGTVTTPKKSQEELKNLPKPEGKKEDNKKTDEKPQEKKPETQTQEKKEDKKKGKKAPKKTEVVVNCSGFPISTKYSMSICKFIKNKKISQAISDLQQVILLKKPIPMKGEIPHRKGKIMSGRYPIRASKYFIKALKGLQGNANNHELDNPIIVEAIANMAERPFGQMGRTKKKRTHLKIIAREKSKILKKKTKKVKK